MKRTIIIGGCGLLIYVTGAVGHTNVHIWLLMSGLWVLWFGLLVWWGDPFNYKPKLEQEMTYDAWLDDDDDDDDDDPLGLMTR